MKSELENTLYNFRPEIQEVPMPMSKRLLRKRLQNRPISMAPTFFKGAKFHKTETTPCQILGD